MIPALIAGGMAVWRGASIASVVAPLVKPAIGVAKRFMKQTARPGIGSKVTSGPLKLGKQTLIGPTRPGVGTIARGVGVVAAGAVGVRAVASHRTAYKPKTQTRPQPQRITPKPSAGKSEKMCCPKGTKRMVCFKRGRVKPRKKKTREPRQRKAKSKRKFSAKQLANQRRFAAAARARRLR